MSAIAGSALAGAGTIIAVDIDDAKLNLASRLGATVTVNALKEDPAAFIKKQIGGAHGALVTAVSPKAFEQSLGMVRRGGTVSLVGLPPGGFELSIFNMVLNGVTVRGSIVGTRFDLKQALILAAQAGIKAEVHPARLDDVNDVLDKMEYSSLPGRTVLEF